MTSPLELSGAAGEPYRGAPPRAPVARRPKHDRRSGDRRRSGTAASAGVHRAQDRLWAGAPRAGVMERDGVMIVTPLGTLRDPLPATLVDQVEASARRPVIVDLSQITLVSAVPVMGLAGWVLGASHEPDQCCVVCPRPTARALLQRWHVTRCLAIFGSVGDALQARRFADEGFGQGWHPATAATSHRRLGWPAG